MDYEDQLDREKLAELMITQSETEAKIVKSLLEASGIECVMITQVPHNLYPFTVDGLAAIRIKVLASCLEEAKVLLREYEADPDADAGEETEEEGRP